MGESAVNLLPSNRPQANLILVSVCFVLSLELCRLPRDSVVKSALEDEKFRAEAHLRVLLSSILLSKAGVIVNFGHLRLQRLKGRRFRQYLLDF